MISRQKRNLFALTAILFGLVAGTLLAEVYLRIRPPHWLEARMKDLNLTTQAGLFGSDAGWSVERIDGKFIKFSPYTHFEMKYDEYDKHVDIDRWGGRVVNGNASEKGKIIVPFLGDSFLFGVGVADRETWVSLLAEKTSIQYLNLGVPGCALPQQLDILEFRHRELGSPSTYVFSFFTGNDFTDIIQYYTDVKSGNAGQKSLLLSYIDSLIYRFHFLGKSYLMEFIKQVAIDSAVEEKALTVKRRAWVMRSPNGSKIADPTFLLMDRRQLFRKEAEEYLEKSLHRLSQIATRDHFVPVFVVIPDKHQVDPRLLQNKAKHYGIDLSEYDTRLPDAIIDQELQKFHIRYFDVYDQLEGKSGLYYSLDEHFTPAGCRAVAHCLQNNLNPLVRSMAAAY